MQRILHLTDVLAKLAVAFLVAVALMCCVSSGVAIGGFSLVPNAYAASSFSGGTGTSDDPYKISTAADLKALAADVNGGTNYGGTYFILTKDLDLSGVSDGENYIIGQTKDFQTVANPFNGIFDGQGYTISNLSIDITKVPRPYYEGTNKQYSTLNAGLFGCLSGAAQIKNLSLQGFSISGDSSDISRLPNTNGNSSGTDDLVVVGTLAGCVIAAGNQTVSITNCNVAGSSITDTCTATYNHCFHAYGGLVGYHYSATSGQLLVVRNCFVQCNLTALGKVQEGFTGSKFGDGSSALLASGGIVALMRAYSNVNAQPPRIENCAYTGDIQCDGAVNPFFAGTRSNNIYNTGLEITLLQQVYSCYYGGGSFKRADGSDGPNPDTNMVVSSASDASNHTFVGNEYSPHIVWGNSTPEKRANAIFHLDFDPEVTLFNASDSNDSGRIMDLLIQNAADANDDGAEWRYWRMYSSQGKYLPVVEFLTLKEASDSPSHGYRYVEANIAGKLANDQDVSFSSVSDFSATVNGQPVEGLAMENGLLRIPAQTSQITVSVVADGVNRGNLVLRKSSLSVEASKEIDSAAQLITVTASEKATRLGFSDGDLTFVWMKLDGGSWVPVDASEVESYANGGKTIVLPLDTSIEKLRVQVTPANSDLQHLQAQSNSLSLQGVDVFVDYAGLFQGNDANMGTMSSPVKTLARAYELVAEDADMSQNHIYLMSDYTDNDWGNIKTAASAVTLIRPATIMGVTVDDDRTFWEPNPNRVFALYTDANMETGKFVFADTAFESLIFKAGKASGSNNLTGAIYAQCHNLTIGKKITMVGYRNQIGKASGQNGAADNNPSDSLAPDFHVYGGYLDWTGIGAENEALSAKPYTITINSGTYCRILAGARNTDKVTGKKNDNCFGDRDHCVQSNVIIDIQEGQSTTDFSVHKYDIASLFGGQTDGSFYGSANIRLTEANTAKTYYVVGANMSYPRTKNDFVGAVNLELLGGEINTVFGGCLGRSNSSTVVNAAFYPHETCRFFDDCDISVTIGKSAHVIRDVYGAGAGGQTGSETVDSKGNGGLATVKVTVEGGKVDGNVYGGGGGFTPMVSSASASSQAGNLYGASYVVVTGGSIGGGVFGGGAGTHEYSNVSRLQALAQVIGTANVLVSGGSIGGGVFGGGNGFTDLPDMAKVTGTANVIVSGGSLADGTHVYGGGAYGQVVGNTNVQVKAEDGDVLFNCDFYGGGKGFFDEDHPLDNLEVGLVTGASKVVVDHSDAVVAGNVYGGGAYGQVKGTTAAQVAKGKVVGNVYGAGKGVAVANSEVGLVTDSSSVAVTGGSVEGNVFGGGAYSQVPVSHAKVQGGTVSLNVYGAGEGVSESGSSIGLVTDNATAEVTGGTVKGNVFGGGAYSPTQTSSALVSGGLVKGDVFGAGQGLEDVSSLGTVYDSALVTTSGGTVEGNVYGGGAFGNVDGNARVTAEGESVIMGSVYGGGKGSGSADYEVGTVTGNASVLLSGASQCGTSGANAHVYGGGAYGTVKGNTLVTVGDSRDSTAIPAVYGSVFGAGQGIEGGVKGTVEGYSQVRVLSTGEAGIAGNVYGGGALGTVKTLASGDDETSDFNTRVIVEGGVIGGSVFGAGMGLASDKPQGEVPCAARVVVSGGVVKQNVYGGGENGVVGSVQGAAEFNDDCTNVRVYGNASVEGNVYGAGKGASEGALTGQVYGDSSVLMQGGTVGQSVYGGGENGTVGVGEDNDVSLFATSKVTITDGCIEGSVFGAGRGSNGSTVLGALYGTAKVYVYGGTVIQNIYGGGNESRVYAGGEGRKATNVVLNSTDDDVFVLRDGDMKDHSFGCVAKAGDAGAIRLDDVSEKIASLSLGPNRRIVVGGSVLGGGNVSDSGTAMATVNTVFGDVDVCIKGAGVEFDNASGTNGGVYGDGNLSLVDGKRYITLVNFREGAGSSSGLKNFFSLQRADYAVLHDSAIYTKGAADVVDNLDSTEYAVNRIGYLKLYNGSTIQLDTVVSRLQNLWSDVATDVTFTKPSNGHVGNDGAVDEWEGSGDGNSGEMKAYRDAVLNGGTWSAFGGEYSLFNMVTLNNGRPLKVADAPDSEDVTHATDFGQVVGMFTLNLMDTNLSEGGGFVYGAKGLGDTASTLNDSPGHFCSINTDSADESKYLVVTTKQLDDRRVWYIKGNWYTYREDLKAVVSGEEAGYATKKLWLPLGDALVSAQAQDKRLVFSMESVAFGSDFHDGVMDADDNALNTLRYKNEFDAHGQIAVKAVFGNQQDDATADTRVITEFQNRGVSADKVKAQDGSYVLDVSSMQGNMVPVTFYLDTNTNMPRLTSGYIKCVLTSQKGMEVPVDANDPSAGTALAYETVDTYTLYIHVIVERTEAQGYVISAPGKLYGGVDKLNDKNITSISAWTADFTTIYSPGSYNKDTDTVKATMSIIPNVKANLNSSNENSDNVTDTYNTFPAGTEITMVDLTNRNNPVYYLYVCEEAMGEVFLTDFVSMSDATKSFQLHTEMARTRERLVFIFDYENASWDPSAWMNNGTEGVISNPQYAVLRHTHTDVNDPEKTSDLLHYGIYEIRDGEDKLVAFNPAPYARRGIMKQERFEADTKLTWKAVKDAGQSLVESGYVNEKRNPVMYDVYAYELFLDMPNDKIDTNNGALNTIQDSSDLVLAMRFTTANGKPVVTPQGVKVLVKPKEDEGVGKVSRYAFSSGDTVIRADYDVSTSAFYAKVEEGHYLVEVCIPRNLDNGRFASDDMRISACVSASPDDEFGGANVVKAGNGSSNKIASTFEASFKPNLVLPNVQYELRVLDADQQDAKRVLKSGASDGLMGYVKLWRTLDANATNLDDSLGSRADDVVIYVDGQKTDAVYLINSYGGGAINGTGETDSWTYGLYQDGLAAGAHELVLCYGGTREIVSLQVKAG